MNHNGSFTNTPTTDTVNIEKYSTLVEEHLTNTGAMSQSQLVTELNIKKVALLGVLHSMEHKKRITTTRLGLGDRLVMLREED